MNLVPCAAIVIGVRDYGESDKLVTFFSSDRGKITGIAKGARRSRRRFVNKLELFSHLTLFLRASNRSSLAFISEAELVNAHINIRQDYSRYTAASLICEPVLRFTAEHDPDQALFLLLCWALTNLDQGVQPLRTAFLFLLRFLVLSGYQPGLSACGRCERPVKAPEQYGFHLGEGSLICSQCAARKPIALLPLSLETIQLLRTAMEMKIKRLNRLVFSSQATREAPLLLQRYSRHLYQRDIQGWKTLVKGHTTEGRRRYP